MLTFIPSVVDGCRVVAVSLLPFFYSFCTRDNSHLSLDLASSHYSKLDLYSTGRHVTPKCSKWTETTFSVFLLTLSELKQNVFSAVFPSQAEQLVWETSGAPFKILWRLRRGIFSRGDGV